MYDNARMGTLLTLRDVESLTKLSRSTIDRLEREGKFPPRRHVSSRAVRWLGDEVEAWMRRGGGGNDRASS
jgi:predicted DNA-binding transcriptional regulator AlpA